MKSAKLKNKMQTEKVLSDDSKTAKIELNGSEDKIESSRPRKIMDGFDYLISKVLGNKERTEYFASTISSRVSDSMKRKTETRLEAARKTILNTKPGQWRVLQMRNDYEIKIITDFIKSCEISKFLKFEIVVSDLTQKRLRSIIPKSDHKGCDHPCSVCRSWIIYDIERVPVKQIRVLRSVKQLRD